MSNPPPGLTEFLTDEVKARHYADLLLDRASAAARGEDVAGASGNAYHVGFDGGEVVIEHHYIEDWTPVRVPLDSFRAALARHRDSLP